MRRVVFHVPHDGAARPIELMKSVCVPGEVFSFYENKMRDTDVRKMIPTGCESVCFEVSRLLCDVERFSGESEPMEGYGMGFCYQKVYDGTEIKKIKPELIGLTKKYYKQHHERMDNIARTSPRGLFLIDLHSFCDEIVMNQTPEFPDICIGYEPEYCPESIVKLITKLCKQSGYSVSINFPYSGSFVPNAVLNKSALHCSSIMMEIHKRVYRTDVLTDKAALAALRNLLASFVGEIR